MPMARPQTQAATTEVKRAINAAASAGTTISGRVSVSSEMSGAARTPSVPATRHAMSVLIIESRFGERPTSIADTSFSEAARDRRPKLLQR